MKKDEHTKELYWIKRNPKDYNDIKICTHYNHSEDGRVTPIVCEVSSRNVQGNKHAERIVALHNAAAGRSIEEIIRLHTLKNENTALCEEMYDLEEEIMDKDNLITQLQTQLAKLKGENNAR